jgi:2-keto-4-pentenoate hydratase/2-oxohepta-3-ene-1,7-dioic acid hydratase in catechol pathway
VRLVAILEGSDRLMAVCVEGGDKAIACMTVDEFYADPERGLAVVAAQSASAPAIALDACTLVPFIPTTARLFCLGLNYRNHADEAGRSVAAIPEVFGRWASTVVPTGTQVPVPPRDPALDWEGELAVIVGRPVYDAEAAECGDAFLGYTCFLDLSARTYQQQTRHATLGKNADRSGPLGPALVTADEIPDPARLRLRTRVNDVVMQDGTTADMIFTPADVAAYVSGVTRLLPGDVISTGTPAGVGTTRTPPVYLTAGDRVEVEIEHIGILRASVCDSADLE